MPPDTTAPITKGKCAPVETESTMAIGIITENVPQLVPVENAINEGDYEYLQAKTGRYNAIKKPPKF